MEALMCASLGLALAALGVAAPQEELDEGPTYQFKYQIHDLMTKDYKTHEEVGENGIVRGTYTVREANGDLRVVSYTAGDSRGFQAMVRVRPTLAITNWTEGQLSASQGASTTEPFQGKDEPLKIKLHTERRFSISKIGEKGKRKVQRSAATSSASQDSHTTVEPNKTNSTYDVQSDERVDITLPLSHQHKPQRQGNRVSTKLTYHHTTQTNKITPANLSQTRQNRSSSVPKLRQGLSNKTQPIKTPPIKPTIRNSTRGNTRP